MVDAGIGRLLISSLHQGIADVSPTRLDFYENWLSPAGMRDGRIGLAPLGAVLSFLHREEPPANEQIVERAGRYAADWTFEDVSALRRWYISRLPMALRKAIDYRKRNGLDAADYEEPYWGRWFYTFNVLALCLAAVPFAFGTLRSGGMGRRLFVGIVFALGFWLVQTQFVRMAGVFKFDFRLAYLIPPVIMLATSAVLFRRRSG